MKPEHNSTHAGQYAWLAIAGFVAIFDRFSSESLTHAAGRGLENPKSRPFVVAAIGITALHLLDVLPREIDPYYRWLDVSKPITEQPEVV